MVIVIVVLIVALLGAVGYICYDKGIIFSKNEVKEESTEVKEEKEESTEENSEEENLYNDITTKINKRLYSLNSDMHPQRYYLLLDDVTYGMEENFLNKKTYILDTNMVEGTEIIKEIDLASVFRPVVENYINTHKGNREGICTVEYFSALNGSTPPPIDFEKEVAIHGYYRCVNGNVETSIGNEIYAYNVETNTIRDLGAR